MITEKVRQAYKKAGLQRDFSMTEEANERNYERFMEIYNAEKEAFGKAPELHEYIDAVYRAESGGKEYVFYHARKHFVTEIGEDKECYLPHIGKQEMPQFTTRVKGKLSKNGDITYEKVHEITGHKTDYDIEHTPANLKKLAKHYHSGTRFYIVGPHFRHTLSRDEFENGDGKTLLSREAVASRNVNDLSKILQDLASGNIKGNGAV